MSTAASNGWPTLGILAAAIVLLVVYVAAAVAGWIKWAAWMPVVLSLGFVAWSAAIRVKRVA
jgi:hypothetical protein